MSTYLDYRILFRLIHREPGFTARWDIEKEMVFVKGGASHRVGPLVDHEHGYN